MATKLSEEDKKQLLEMKEASIELISNYYDAVINEDWKTVAEISRKMGELFGDINSQMTSMDTDVEEYMYYIADEAEYNMTDDDDDDEDDEY